MGKKRKELSQEEIWDDRGLIESWNQSYEEYKMYHSIHARGERVKDVLAAAEAEEAADTSKPDLLPANGAVSFGKEDQVMTERDLVDPTEGSTSVDKALTDADVEPAVERKDISSSQTETQGDFTNRAGHGASQEASLSAQDITNQSTTDRGLKDLMMSWYWTGYYTGLYEGQRAAKAEVGDRSDAAA